MLVKAREGRPIHVEGNAEHPLYRGKTSFHATADLLGLYDPDRLRAPLIDGRPGTWKAAVEQLARALQGCEQPGQGHRSGHAGGAFSDAQGADRALGRGLAVSAPRPMGARGRPSRPPGPARAVRRRADFPSIASTKRKPSSRWKPIFSEPWAIRFPPLPASHPCADQLPRLAP